jgi:chitinase
MGAAKGVSITLPASYWYLRGFDIVNLEKYVDFFNIMTYDIRKHNTPGSTWKRIFG